MALLCVVERQLEHVIGTVEVFFVGHCRQIKLQHLVWTCTAVGIGILLRNVAQHFVLKTADDNPVQEIPFLQGCVQLVCRSHAHVSPVLDFNDEPILPGRGQIVQHLVQGQNPQLFRNRIPVEVCIGHLPRIIFKLRSHIQLFQLFQCFFTDFYVFAAKHGHRVRHPVQGLVMGQHQHIVRRHVQVEFKVIHLYVRVFHAASESRKGFLREFPRAAAMGRNGCCSGNQRVIRIIVLHMFGVGPMIKLGHADDAHCSCQGKQNSQTNA